MGNHNPKNQFDSKRASEAGKKSKRGKSIKTILENILSAKGKKEWVEELKAKGIDTDGTIGDILQAKLVAWALDGDLKALQEIHNRLEGKPRERVDVAQDSTIELRWPKDNPENL